MANSRGAKTGIKAAFQKPMIHLLPLKYMAEQPLTGVIRLPTNKKQITPAASGRGIYS
jgi:hypothetical protein